MRHIGWMIENIRVCHQISVGDTLPMTTIDSNLMLLMKFCRNFSRLFLQNQIRRRKKKKLAQINKKSVT